MKKIFFAFIVSLMVLGCNNDDKKEDASSSKATEMKALYEKNLATMQAFVAAFEKEDAVALAAQVADSAVCLSPAYGDTVTTKAHWMASLKYYMDNWSNLHLSNAQFLPGIDSATHEFDGSVRYYGNWDGVHSSGLATRVKYYGTFDFNKDNKIINGSDFFDLGGLMNAVKPKSK